MRGFLRSSVAKILGICNLIFFGLVLLGKCMGALKKLTENFWVIPNIFDFLEGIITKLSNFMMPVLILDVVLIAFVLLSKFLKRMKNRKMSKAQQEPMGSQEGTTFLRRMRNWR